MTFRIRVSQFKHKNGPVNYLPLHTYTKYLDQYSDWLRQIGKPVPSDDDLLSRVVVVEEDAIDFNFELTLEFSHKEDADEFVRFANHYDETYDSTRFYNTIFQVIERIERQDSPTAKPRDPMNPSQL